MEIRKVDPQVSISAEPALSDFSRLAEDGVQTVVCNRLEGEADSQPSFAELEATITAVGMELVLLPFARGEMQPEQVEVFAELMESGQRIHAFCRSGNRSYNLWLAARDL